MATVSNPSTVPTLYLIDGYAQFFRAYHAIRTPMTSPVTKEPTNMTFGFVGMLLKLLRGEGKLGGPPDYVAVALDVSGDKETFRSELYPEYKATRPPPPQDLLPQVERALAILRELGIPTVGAEGFEADDAIATIVSRLQREHPGLRVRIVSKDKDLKQLLASSVELYDVHTDLKIGVEELKAEMGLDPGQIIDYLALMGDTVDNVPGVEGVGEKTSAALISEHGSLDKLIAAAGTIKGKRGEKIREAIPNLALSKQLVTLRHDAPVELDLKLAAAKSFKLDRLIPILKELGFNRYQEDVRALMLARGETLPAGLPSPMPDALSRSAVAEPKPNRENKPTPGGLFDGGLFAALETPKAISNPGGEYRCIKSRKELDALVKELKAAPVIAIDTETTNVSPTRADLCGISVSTKVGTGAYIPVRSPDCGSHLDEATVLAALKPIFEDEQKPKVGHNLKYDMIVLRRAGVMLKGFAAPAKDGDALAAGDTMVASYLIDASRSSHALEPLGLALLGRTKSSISELIGSGKDQRQFDTVPVDLATPYAAGDADLTLALMQVMLPQLRAMGLMSLFYDLEMPLVEVLAELEFNGIQVDGDELDRQRSRLQSKLKQILDSLESEAKKALGRTFDPDSPKQLSAALFNRPDDNTPGLGIKPIKKTKTGFSTDAEVLEKLGEDATLTTPIPKLILEYRQLSKLVSTYLVALKEEINPKTGRVHTSFNQTVAATGRLASSDPNLQNIPIRTEIGREIRKAFIAAPGHLLVTADYSQIELRLLAHLSNDPALTQAFHEGADIHTAVAAQVHHIPLDQVTKEQRSGAKMVNFGIVYGVTPYGLARRLNIGNDEAAEIINGYKKRFAGITTFLEECVQQAKRYGYVETIMHRRRPILDIESNVPARRAFAERIAINSVVQGSAADLIKLAMVNIQRVIDDGEAPKGLKMLLQIHDELVFEVPTESADAAKKLVVDKMEHAMTLSVPLGVDAHTGKNWFEGK
ncbi:MAG: DNA polymerase I [Phycisphaeraceae bacterium]|nr:DNA polymerase I [Phycisphaeraceae bacterium]